MTSHIGSGEFKGDIGGLGDRECFDNHYWRERKGLGWGTGMRKIWKVPTRR